MGLAGSMLAMSEAGLPGILSVVEKVVGMKVEMERWKKSKSRRSKEEEYASQLEQPAVNSP
jgi:hypothetical protein